MIDKSQYLDWRNNPVTELMFKEMKDQLDYLEEVLDTCPLSSHAELIELEAQKRIIKAWYEYNLEFDDNDYAIDEKGVVIE